MRTFRVTCERVVIYERVVKIRESTARKAVAMAQKKAATHGKRLDTWKGSWYATDLEVPK